MKLIMLGHTGVGKTTYMASMYGALQERIHGFSLLARDEDAHQDLLAMAQVIGRGRYPAATDQRAEYRFKLTHNGKAFFPFTWVDYRGGALVELSSSAQAQELLRDLAKADGILMFCDSQALEKGGGSTNQVGRMTNLIGQALQRIDHPISLVVVLTKADLVSHRNGHYPAPLLPLQETVAASQMVSGTFIRVACGRRPRNVEKPVLFALRIGILSQVLGLQAGIESHARKQEQLANQAGFFDDIFSWLADEPSYRDLAAKEADAARKLLAKMEPLVAPAEALGEYLEDLTSF